ncbi:ionotropic receptor 93a-like [Macrobrachium nipponense]|uniref:ionotropic receptor 93a-like n=1 Tax=Macrobrachium nipponense TaxID=159736 RepID=UPI0030C8947C
MSPMKLAIMPHLLKELDFTVPIEPATLTFSMAKPTLKPRWQSLYYPLTGQVWASILAMMIIMPVVFIVITNIGNTRENKGLPGRIILEMTGTLLGQNFTSEPSTTNSARLLVGFWVVFAFIMGTAYRGNLTAFLTIPKYPPRAENLPQLLAKNAKYENLFLFTTFAGSYAIFEGATSIAPCSYKRMPPDAVDFYNGFKQSPSSEFRTLSERVTFVDSFWEGLQMAEASNSAYMYERRFMELMIARHFTPLQSSSRLYVARQNVWPGYSAWPIIRDAPFKPVIDRCIQAFNEAGLIEKWGDMVVEDARRISRQKKRFQQQQQEEETRAGDDEEIEEKEEEEEAKSDQRTEASQALTIVHMQGPLFLLLLGLEVAGSVFAVEVMLHACFVQR